MMTLSKQRNFFLYIQLFVFFERYKGMCCAFKVRQYMTVNSVRHGFLCNKSNYCKKAVSHAINSHALTDKNHILIKKFT